MFRWRQWTRSGLVALVLATSALWVSVAVTPSAAVSSGTKSLDPSDPGSGGGPTAGDPDGPTGDIGPAGGSSSWSGGSTYSGGYTSSVQAPVVSAAKPTVRWFDWVHLKLALQFWLGRALWP